LYRAEIIFRLKKQCHAEISIISIPNRFCKTPHFVDHAFQKQTAIGRSIVSDIIPAMPQDAGDMAPSGCNG
jgi:hypothetical protein